MSEQRKTEFNFFIILLLIFTKATISTSSVNGIESINESNSNAIPKENESFNNNEETKNGRQSLILPPQLYALASRLSEDNYVPHQENNVVDTTELWKRNQNVPYLPTSNLPPAVSQENVMEETIRFLDEGQKSMNISDAKDVIIIVGNTGSGKTTFSHFIAGDNDLLISVPIDDDEEDVEVDSDDDSDEDSEHTKSYLIEDVFDKISKADMTTVSKTIVPELITDSEDIVWYDCPGFSDTRNTTVEIATTYFVKSVIDSATRIKIVFVVNHVSVIPGIDRSDLDKMVRHGVQLIRDIDRYKLSVALVASKAEAYYPQSRKLYKSSLLIKRIGKYIDKYRKELVSNDDSDEDSKKAAKLLDALLVQDEAGNYNRIGVFFRPDKPGPLSKIPLMQKCREEIRNMVKNNLNYSDVLEEDFGYTLSAKAQNHVADLSRLISKNITASVENIGEQIILFYKRQERAATNLVKQKEVFVHAENAIADLKTNAKHMTPKTLITKLINFTIDEQIFIPGNEIENIARQQKYLEFLDRVSIKLLPVSSNDWIVALEKCFDYILQQQNWYIVLVELHEILSHYDIQNKLELYDVADISNWKKGGQRGIHIHHYNFHSFLKLHRNFYDLLKNMEIDDIKLSEINEVLNVTLKHQIEYDCTDDTLTAKREFLKVSEINLKQCGPNVKRLHLFALQTLFADADLSFQGDDKEVAIIANKLDVPVKATFSLQGVDNTYVPPKQPQPDKTRIAGKAGEPGKPGGNGANFFGLFNEVSNGEKLVINAVGGSGSIGQDGGSAYPQQPDRPNAEDTPEDQDLFGTNVLQKLKDNGIITDYKWGFGYILDYTKACHATSVGYTTYHQFPYTIYGKCCASDGLAGAGGIGGYSGQTKLIAPAASLPLIVTGDGKNGQNGTNVKPCVTNKSIITNHAYCKKKFFYGYYTGGTFKFTEAAPDQNCPPHKEYTDFITTNRKSPSPTVELKPYKSIISYKAYLREKLNSGIRTQSLFDLHNKIEENEVAENTYNVIAFAEELRSYEKHFYAINNHIDFIPFYESFLQRVESYSQLNTTETNSYENKKVLAWLYTSALSKVQALRTNRYSNLVIDIEKYFETTRSNIKELSDANKKKIIDKRKDEYRKELNAKIDEATKFIDGEIKPEIDNIFVNFDTAIDGLLTETIIKQNETKKDIKKLQENKKQLEKNMKLRLLGGVFKGVGQCASFFGPIGALANTAFETASSVTDSFIVDPDAPKKRFTMPSGLKKMLDSVGSLHDERKKEKIKALDKQIGKLDKILNEPKYTVIAKDMKKAITDIKDKLDKEKNSEAPNKNTIDELNKQFLTLVKERKDQLNRRPETEAKEFAKTLDLAGKLIEVADISIELYNKYKENEDKINELVKTIDTTKDDLHKYQRYEQKVYETLLPSIYNAKDEFKALEENLHGQSHVSLDVQKWKVQSNLNDLKEDLVTFVKGFSAEDDVRRCVEKLTDAIVTMIGIYDRIQSYEEQEKLAAFIAALHSDAYEDIQIGDAELRNVVTDLRVTITSNIVLSQYLNAVHNFKQIVFPFAPAYLDVYRLPSNLTLDKSLNDLVNTAVHHIDSLSDTIKELNGSVINQNDVVINTGYFNGDNAALDPFYVWTYEEHKKDIFDLLSGKKVYLRAHVTRNTKWNAVKFNEIGIEFRVRNTTDKQLQEELKSVLNRFHITMTHMGNSYYRCDNRFYVIHSPSQTITFSYEIIDKERTFKNDVYGKLKSGNFILSPYTLWSIELKNADVKLLEKYRHAVNIELYGYGQCVNRNVAICYNNLEKYYDQDDSLSEIGNFDEQLLVESAPDAENYLNLDYLF